MPGVDLRGEPDRITMLGAGEMSSLPVPRTNVPMLDLDPCPPCGQQLG